MLTLNKVFNCLRNLAPSYLMNMCQPVTSNLHRRRLRSAVRGDLIVPPTKTVRYWVFTRSDRRTDRSVRLVCPSGRSDDRIV